MDSQTLLKRIRSDIICGTIGLGEQLKQSELAERYSVSKIPLREALVQLTSEGLVTSIKNRGSVVSQLSIEEMEELYVMRRALEVVALERAFPLLGKRNFISAAHHLTQCEHSNDAYEWTTLNWDFHFELYRPSNMPHLLNTLHQLHNNVTRYMVLYLKEMDFQSLSQEEHRELLEACEAQDKRGAIRILKAHIDSALQHTLHYMKETRVC